MADRGDPDGLVGADGLLLAESRTPIGLVAQTAAAAARAGICRIREYPFVTASGEPMMVASELPRSPAKVCVFSIGSMFAGT